MLSEIITRFIIGGIVVSFFAVLGDVLKPKSFAGLFSAAPSIALASIALTVAKNGKAYAAAEGHSMIVGSVAFFVYAIVVVILVLHWERSAIAATLLSAWTWFMTAFGIWFGVLR